VLRGGKSIADPPYAVGEVSGGARREPRKEVLMSLDDDGFSALKRVARAKFWELDPASVSDEPEFTFSEYFEIADRAARRISAGADFKVVEEILARELREDWGVPRWFETAHEVVLAMREFLARDH
jgi:hypothetical protein